jgi:hypothetical protein
MPTDISTGRADGRTEQKKIGKFLGASAIDPSFFPTISSLRLYSVSLFNTPAGRPSTAESDASALLLIFIMIICRCLLWLRLEIGTCYFIYLLLGLSLSLARSITFQNATGINIK